MDKRKRVVVGIIIAVIFFAIGNVCAYIFLHRGESLPAKTGFQNPTGAPYVKGPSGPPPQSFGETSPLPQN